ncbi:MULTISPECIES: 50S ribosomal protein L7/L12 [unclassified Tolypothrix]|uniref:50S ribosomal protein L7/L12 n=1 Tax=unclassified Tolypothrix TaxID=2649714 RepID=UPI0005EAB256|nr:MULTISPECIES: 50S ribosomal protein L7/L12 [unclassified Tolypothrix]BAY90193.1 50S ribosomal protein L7/L12 [Microchaete diplosiphon NIES-3275]EKF01772.1 ribosomal protein L7/L12 [Tolypothrix sp. PCC 7601]MBE9083256.1 50S ribosomal protein L7/L12 [Tolypothrix sp. LEGE 11397]UYD24394.1 50S ribosomal protein L7/L12 [Tolypothrix sp. PCC 7712]UYD33372.1 50S ribosomal protein L7/L12 [Tolypothrix sp. PCC 7601]
MSVKTLEILEQIKSLTLNETSQLVKQIEATFNVDISTPKLIQIDQRDEDEVQLQVQTEFDVLLVSVPPEKKIALLKVIRTVTGLGLKEAKDFVDSLPKVVQTGLDREAAQVLKQQLEETGAVVSLQ